MTTPNPSRPLSKASEEAVEWHVRLTSGAATDEDWQSHQDWLAADPANLEAFDRVQQSWSALDDARDTVLNAFPVTKARQAPSRGWLAGLAQAFAWPVRAPIWQSAMAGAAAVFLVVLAVTLVPGLITPKPQVYATAVGQVRTVRLADGSTAALDTDTEIRVHYRGRDRTAELVHGSVLFDVVHDPDRPFKVTAGPHEVSVLGTKFEVSWRDQRTVVAVARGIVAVSATPEAGVAATDTHRLERGQRLIYRTPTSAALSEAVDPDNVGSWERGQLVFDGAPLAQVVERLNHYFPGMKLEVADPALGAMTFTGVVKIGDAATTARRIAEIMSLGYKESGDTIRLMPKADKT